MSKETGIIAAIYIRPNSYRAEIMDKARLVAGRGIRAAAESDIYRLVDKYYDCEEGQLSIITLDAFVRAKQSGYDIRLPQAGRNIVIANISAERLNRTVNKTVEFKESDVLIEVSGLCGTCSRPDAISGRNGFKEAFTTPRGESMGGVRANIIKGGIIKAGQTVYF